MKNPLISVIIPAWNAELFIEQAIQSALDQSYQNTEIIVVDDGSSDRTAVIVNSFIEKNSNMKLIRQCNQGVAAARNNGIHASSGEYIAPLDADDVWHQDKLEKQLRVIQQAPDTVGLVYCLSNMIDEYGNNLGYRNDQYEGVVYGWLLFGNFVGGGSTPLIKRSCLEQVQGYDVDYFRDNAQGCEDLDLYLRIAEQYEYSVVPEYLSNYRIFPTSMSENHASMAKSYIKTIDKIKYRVPQLPLYIYRWSVSRFLWTLVYQCKNRGQFRASLKYGLHSIYLDPVRLLHAITYRTLLAALVKSTKSKFSPRSLQSPLSDSRNNKSRSSKIINKQVIKKIHKLSELHERRKLKTQLLVLDRKICKMKSCNNSSSVSAQD